MIVESANIEQISMDVKGMTCAGCEEHVKNAAYKLEGVLEANASHAESSATIKFDKSKVSKEEVISAVNETGYQVADYKLTQVN